MTPATPLRETDLFAPVRSFLEASGHTVRAEVADCDVVGYAGGKLVVVELKTRITLELLAQATARQRFADLVYVAVPGPIPRRSRRRWRGIKRLLRRLELGLLLVYPTPSPGRVEEVHPPKPYRMRKSSQQRAAVLEEMVGRTATRNTGGSTRRKRVTAYRENAIQIAVVLDRFGPLSASQLQQQHNTGSKTHAILYRDYYGWFERVGRGVYGVSAAGRRAFDEFPTAVSYYRELVDDHALTQAAADRGDKAPLGPE
ncbi:hypothetical protein JW848_04290 [Candidatus Bipolaricaulota bacterium]|nr:hypothetical protein [Candidatus Bipolaricaulota bacterium]